MLVRFNIASLISFFEMDCRWWEMTILFYLGVSPIIFWCDGGRVVELSKAPVFVVRFLVVSAQQRAAFTSSLCGKKVATSRHSFVFVLFSFGLTLPSGRFSLLISFLLAVSSFDWLICWFRRLQENVHRRSELADVGRGPARVLQQVRRRHRSHGHEGSHNATLQVRLSPPMLPSFPQVSRVLSSFTEFWTSFNRVLPICNWIHRVFPSLTYFYRVLPSSTDFYWIVPSFTGSYRVYWVQLGLIGPS